MRTVIDSPLVFLSTGFSGGCAKGSSQILFHFWPRWIVPALLQCRIYCSALFVLLIIITQALFPPAYSLPAAVGIHRLTNRARKRLHFLCWVGRQHACLLIFTLPLSCDTMITSAAFFLGFIIFIACKLNWKLPEIYKSRLCGMSQVALVWRKILFYTWNFSNMEKVIVLQARFHHVISIAVVWLTYAVQVEEYAYRCTFRTCRFTVTLTGSGDTWFFCFRNHR